MSFVKELEQREDLLVWIDLETTGLDLHNQMNGVHEHRILEIGIHITDSKFKIIDEGLSIVVKHNIDYVKYLMDDYVLNMHLQNGLLDKVEKSKITLEDAEKLILDYLGKYNIKPKSSPICGNNVSFDKNFIDAQMPSLSNFLHYRKIDVSSLKEITRRLYPDVYNFLDKSYNHRGLDDIKESIKELNYYLDSVFLKD